MNSITLIILAIGSVILISVTHSSGEIISSPRITNWGIWGTMERCPQGTFVNGFRLKTEPYEAIFGDDSAGNGVRLYCVGLGLDFEETLTTTNSIISSSVGPFGRWGNVYTCPSGSFINGFVLNVQPYSSLGNSATNNFRFYCNHNPNYRMEGDGLYLGSWGSSVKCRNASHVLCGIRTQVEPDQGFWGDDTALNNIQAECCELPMPTPEPTTPAQTETSSMPITTETSTTPLTTEISSTTTTENPSTPTENPSAPTEPTTSTVTPTTQEGSTSTSVPSSTTRPDCNHTPEEYVLCPPGDPNGYPTYLPYPYDCTKFIICTNGIPRVECCPEGTRWDQELTTCNHEVAIECIIVSTTTTFR